MDKGGKKNPKDYYKKALTLADLKPGDILTFEGEENDTISFLIMKLTNSVVTHGALYFQDSPVKALADAGKSGLHAHKVENKPKSRNVYVSRIKMPGQGGFFGDDKIYYVLHSAKGYLNSNLKYPYSDLVLLALIMVFKDISKVSISLPVILGVLKFVTVEIKRLIDARMHEGKHPMVCSAFVYQCYLDAGKKDERLKLNLNADADMGEFTCRSVRQLQGAKTLFELYAEHAEEYNYKTELFATREPEVTKEELDALLKQGVEDVKGDRVMVLKNFSLSGVIEKFLEVLLDYYGIEWKDTESLIEKARKFQSMFVTPNDLCFHIDNTEKLGYIALDRHSKDLPDEEITTKYDAEK